MFSNLRKKIKNVFGSKDENSDIDELNESEELIEEKNQDIQESSDTKGEQNKNIKNKDSNSEKTISTQKTKKNSVEKNKESEDDIDVEESEENKEEKSPKKKGFFKSFSLIKIDEEKFEDLFFELEINLLENNIALEVVDEIRETLRERIVNQSLSRFKINQEVNNVLKEIISNELSLSEPKDDFFKVENKPKIILFFGINGSGKTTTLAKIAKKIIDNNQKLVVAAADTFRAAAIDQLEHHCNLLNVKMIKHNYGSDPSAVVYDAIEHAKSKNLDFVLIDSAGRTNMNENLLKELKKMVSVSKPDLKIFVADSLVGNDLVDQAQKFDEMIGVDGVVLTKVDANEKGGSIVSLSHKLKKPIYFLGIGQKYEDLEEFSSEFIVSKIFDEV